MSYRNLGDIPQNLRPDRPAREGSQTPPNFTPDNQIVQRAQFSEQLSNVTDSQPQPILNDNYRRNYLLIQNNGATDVFINFGVKANTGNIKIIAGGNYEPRVVPVNSIYLVSGAGNENLCAIAEGVEIN
jgi:hypothetical protein